MAKKKAQGQQSATAPTYAQQDPFYERERSKYEHPVPSRELILAEMEKIDKPVTLPQLIQTFALVEEDAKEGIRRRLFAMTRDGQIMATRQEHFALVKHMQLVRGRVTGHRDGFGFLVPDDGGNDVFLSPRQMRQVFPDDRVLCRIQKTDRGGRREGSIVEILERCTLQLVGKLHRQDEADFVEPIAKQVTHSVLIPRGQRGKAKEGQFVVVSIITQPGKHHPCTGKVIEVLGDQMTPAMEIELAVRSHGLPHQWSDEIQKAANALGRCVGAKDKQGRVDLTATPFVTIDGEDAKDFDDAICAERQGKGWLLRVAIADVSHYVKPGDLLDQSAYERGNSVYFPGRTVPMLPENLSNGLCSLKPNVERLAMVCEMTLNAQGEVLDSRFYEAVICSHARLTYAQVNDFLSHGKNTVPKKLQSHVQVLHEVFEILHAHRMARGALDFSTTETRIVFNQQKRIEQVVAVQRLVSHRLVEECMLLANITTAKFLLNAKQPGIYRVHPGPSAEKLDDLRVFLKALGLKLGGGDAPEPKDYADLLSKIEGRLDAQLIQTVLLRSLKQAVYTSSNEGHFGLAYEAYTHFTSPIRRYPDLLVHRLIKERLASSGDAAMNAESLQAMGVHCSMTERRADLATRDATDWLKCEFMLDKLGEQFEGIISAVTGFGFYVCLKEVYVEGLVHISCLKNDYYVFDSVHHCLRGRHANRSYRLGDEVVVQVARVSLDDREIDFQLI